jgi:hypothetical protein
MYFITKKKLHFMPFFLMSFFSYINGTNQLVLFKQLGYIVRDLILVQHQYNNRTTTPQMRVGPSMWDPPSCERLLYGCCIGVVNRSNIFHIVIPYIRLDNLLLFK